jgi:Phytanoyl-CoA dioxygenase (PhyH)
MELPALDEPYRLTREQVEALHRDGHLHLRGLLSPAEIEAYRPHVLDAAARAHASVPADERQLFLAPSLWELDERVRRLVWSGRLARVAAELLDVEAVRLWRDVAFFKEPGEPDTPWHQDRHWEPVETAHFLGIWIALTDVTPEMSALSFASGSHRDGRIGLPDHEGRSQRAVTEWIAARHPIVSYAPLEAGDATIHLGWTLHGSPANVSARPRRALSVFYFEDGARITRFGAQGDPTWLRVQRHHVAARLAGRRQGDVAESEQCPVIFRRQ